MSSDRVGVVKRVRQSKVAHNFAAIFGTQLATYVFPLATIPYLARVLEPKSFGMVAFAQALGLYVSMVVEFGFNLSATRRVARFHNDPSVLEEIVAGVMASKMMLSIACIGALLAMQMFMSSFRDYGGILWAGGFSGLAQGFSMLWYFQGMERMKLPAALDVVGKALAAVGIFACVHRPSDAWKVLALQCVCYAASSSYLLWVAYSETRFRWPSWSHAIEALRDSAAMFLFRSSVSLYTTANALILGALSTPVSVGFYSGPERIVKALLNLMSPVTQVLFPRLSRLVATDHGRAIRLVRLSLIAMTVAACVLCIATAVAAPLVTRVVLGPGYGAAVPVMRILALLPPAIAISTVLGMQWMLPLGMDAAYNKIIISAGLLNVALASLLASRWQQIGMAWSVVISEYVVTLAVCFVLARRGMSPLSDTPRLRCELDKQLSGVGL